MAVALATHRLLDTCIGQVLASEWMDTYCSHSTSRHNTLKSAQIARWGAEIFAAQRVTGDIVESSQIEAEFLSTLQCWGL
jgi:hypothetical protein